MSDRELLELAAKAAGLVTPIWQDFPGMDVRYGITCSLWTEDTGHWNPLQDDGDALRLAVKLRIPTHFATVDGRHEFACTTDDDGENWELMGADEPAAMRRAIVTAAAAIGATQDTGAAS